MKVKKVTKDGESTILASWDVAGYNRWPDELVEQGVATLTKTVDWVSDTYLCPLKYVLERLDSKYKGPVVIDEEQGTITKPGDEIRGIVVAK
jgi:hypothetical protein